MKKAARQQDADGVQRNTQSVHQNNHLAMLSQVAHMYYDLHMQQPVIADTLGFSRSKVSRMLAKAEECGVVKIEVERYLSRMPAYEKKLQSMFGLKHAYVMTTFEEDGEDESKEVLASYTADYISGMIKGAYVLGITGSKEVTRAVHKLSKVYPCELQVVQTIGATISPYMSNDLTNYLAQTYGGKAHFLNTPLYVDDLYVKEMLLKDPSVKEAMRLMQCCDLLLMGVGGFDVDGNMPNWYGYMTTAHRKELFELGAVGSICAQFFDVNGNRLSCEWNDKCITIPWDDIKHAQSRVAISSGPHKVLPLVGALRGQLLDVLITDITTAAAVIEKEKQLRSEAGERAEIHQA